MSQCIVFEVAMVSHLYYVEQCSCMFPVPKFLRHAQTPTHTHTQRKEATYAPPLPDSFGDFKIELRILIQVQYQLTEDKMDNQRTINQQVIKGSILPSMYISILA